MLCPEDGSSMFLRNVGSDLPEGTEIESCERSRESVAKHCGNFGKQFSDA
jgi:hypothetical protein